MVELRCVFQTCTLQEQEVKLAVVPRASTDWHKHLTGVNYQRSGLRFVLYIILFLSA